MREFLRNLEPERQDLAQRIGIVVLVSLVVALVGSVLMLHFERGAKGTQITSFGDSVFFVTTQLLTVSSQIQNPFTTEGRILDVFLEIYAVLVVTTVAGAWGSFFHRRSIKRHGLPQKTPKS